MDTKSNKTIQVFWVAMGSLSSLALTIVSAAILSRYFNKSDYGTYKQIAYVYTTLLVIFSAGLPRVFAYFLPRYSIEEGKSIVDKVNRVLFLAGLIFSIVLFTFSGIIASLLKNNELAYALKVFSPIPMFLLPTLGIEGIFSTYNKTIYIAVYETLSRILMLLFIVAPVVIFNGTYISAIYGWLIVSFLTFIMAYFFKGIPFKGIKAKVTTLKYNEIFSYSIPLVVASIWGVAIRSADQFYISRFFGNQVFAEYSNGFTEIPFVSMITASTSIVLMPFFSKMIHNKADIKDVVVVWRNVLLKSAYIIYPIVIFFIFNADYVMTILYSKVYESSKIYFQICMFLNFFNIIIFSPLILAMGETKFYLRLHIFIALLAWGLGYFVVILFKSPEAIAIFSVLLSILKVLMALKFLSSKLNINFLSLFPFKKTFQILIHTCLCMFLVLWLINIYGIEGNIIFRLVVNVILYGFLVLTTAMFFKLEYLRFLTPLIEKLKSYVK